MSQQTLFDADEPQIGDLEDWCITQGCRWIIGVDEAGRGPLAGPVYAAAVAVDLAELDNEWLDGVDDSKKLAPNDRERVYETIEASAPAFQIAASDAGVIDDINILQATLRAMERAVSQVCRQLGDRPDRVFIDGNVPIQLDVPQRTVVGGDARSRAIAAASILAKVARDEVMVDHHQRWPEYHFDTNKGYPTGAHRRAIAQHGPCAVHRLSFNGVRQHRHRLRESS